MKKRPSRRRLKAQALLGRYLPWSVIVERRLETFCQWERRHDYMDAYRIPPRPERGPALIVYA